MIVEIGSGVGTPGVVVDVPIGGTFLTNNDQWAWIRIDGSALQTQVPVPGYLPVVRLGDGVSYAFDPNEPCTILDLKAVPVSTPVLTLDHFTASDGILLDARIPDVGDSWEAKAGSYEVQSGRAVATTMDGTHGDAVVLTDAGASDCTVRAKVRSAYLYNTVGLAVRGQDADNYWLVGFTADKFRILEKQSGTFTVRASVDVATSTWVDYEVEVVLSGGTITATLNGSNQIGYGASSFNQSHTKHGLRAGTVGDSFDDFEVVV